MDGTIKPPQGLEAPVPAARAQPLQAPRGLLPTESPGAQPDQVSALGPDRSRSPPEGKGPCPIPPPPPPSWAFGVILSLPPQEPAKAKRKSSLTFQLSLLICVNSMQIIGSVLFPSLIWH
ncbi:uncharacterized protein LOC128826928 isoform X2 [Malaclemys terrapin pileata]|uniref:uncharacterized protein LOC128826928 isoform X2 n=1 Tax=Malaclemys terrapin pileata TaxID=2991368 RepID=UPI0023A908CD|nr:uncharacterized protein LOC128826928 isoform X2 [Malaclemys terrapin pileata]